MAEMTMDSPLTNESGVREEIIAPILKYLNYSASGPNDIRYEVKLVYTRNFLGRKKKSDPPLMGRADYLCRAGGRVPWTIEAKPPLPISEDDIQQAYSYAKHPEVRAVYFCVCNGMEFRVYDTNADPSVGPVLVIKNLQDRERAAVSLSQLVGVEVLLARHTVALADTRPPIGRGLQSFAQVVGGKIVHDHSAAIPALHGLTISITSGAIQRIEDGSLLAYFEGRAPYAGIQSTLDSLGLKRVVLYSDSNKLSSDLAEPTMFSAQISATFPEGQEMLDLMTHTSGHLPLTLIAEVEFQAVGKLDGWVFAGQFHQKCVYKDGSLSEPPVLFRMESGGQFEFLLK
jgi:hypothetical protein